MTPDPKALEALIAWWRGVAADDWEIGRRFQTYSRGRAHDANTRAAVWDRCAQQLELVLAGKPFNPDV